MDSSRKSRKRILRNREILIKGTSVLKIKKQQTNLHEEKKNKKPPSLNDGESPIRNGSNGENVSEDLSGIHPLNDCSSNNFGGQSVQLVTPTSPKNSAENPKTENVDNSDWVDQENNNSIRSISPETSYQQKNDREDETRMENEFLQKEWMKDVRKDIRTLYKAFASVSHDVKEMKRIKKNKRSDSPSSIGSVDEERELFLLPKFKSKKVKRVLEMETNIKGDAEYKKQLIKKFATFGGSTIKQTVINIFDGVFTKKLKTKICWKGTREKVDFKAFIGIRDVLRQAVKTRFKCTRHDIDKECKLRFNQAQKDYDREKNKKIRLN